MNKENKKTLLVFSILVILIVAMVALFTFINPEELVNTLGIQNSYVLAFLVSLFGGFSAGGSVTFIGLLITLVAGGINPLYLGLVSGISLAIGDMIMFYAGSKGRELFNEKWDKKINKAVSIFEEKKWLKKMTPVFAYFYVGFTPLPNDILILFLVTIKYPIKKAKWIIILGDLTFALMITLLTANSLLG